MGGALHRFPTGPLEQLPTGSGKHSFQYLPPSCPLFLFPQELLHVIVQLLPAPPKNPPFPLPPNNLTSSDPLKELLLTCKAAYNTFKPFLRWIQPSDIIQRLVGCYRFTPYQNGFSLTLYTANFKLLDNGKMKGSFFFKARAELTDELTSSKGHFVGKWTLSAHNGVIRVIPKATGRSDFFCFNPYLPVAQFEQYKVDPSRFEMDDLPRPNWNGMS